MPVNDTIRSKCQWLARRRGCRWYAIPWHLGPLYQFAHVKVGRSRRVADGLESRGWTVEWLD